MVKIDKIKLVGEEAENFGGGEGENEGIVGNKRVGERGETDDSGLMG